MEYEIFTKNGKKLRNEGLTIEYKETFNFGSLAKYFKTMMAFANNRGGIIVFGVTNSPRIIKGLDKNSQFYNIDPEKIVKYMKEDMSVILDFEMDTISVDGKELGFIKVDQLKYKPVICKKNENDILKEGSIYYRYSGRSELINYADLRNIIEDIKSIERKAIMNNFNAIIKEGPENIQLINTNTGKIQWGKVPVLISEELLMDLKKEVKFIESGKFDETNGDPTLKVIGSLNSSNIVKVKEKTNINIDYPYFTKDIAKENNITNYQAQTVIHHFHLYGDPRFNQVIITSSKSKITKYSKLAFDVIKDELSRVENRKDFFDKLSKEFQGRKK
ncbi:MAG: putative DNA binding domain-containing protein [Bacilli bacterium]|nr:putative DNA binding domain-containing protein [Bacilli bacterium]